MQVVDDLLENVGRVLVAILVQHKHLHAPFAHRETFDGWFISV
jgi:hypothetical protein